MPADGPGALVERLLAALNAHDLDALAACFADDYVNHTPAHPRRGFTGVEQVRANWAQLFAGVPDLRARLPLVSVDGDTVWTEWDLAGTRRDGARFEMRGVAIFTVAAGRFAAVRFYLEPVEDGGEGIDAATGRLAGQAGVAP
jgi:ketosteroid isomerase-like protein